MSETKDAAVDRLIEPGGPMSVIERRLFEFTDEDGDTVTVDLLRDGQVGVRAQTDLGGDSWAASSAMLPVEQVAQLRDALSALLLERAS